MRNEETFLGNKSNMGSRLQPDSATWTWTCPLALWDLFLALPNKEALKTLPLQWSCRANAAAIGEMAGSSFSCVFPTLLTQEGYCQPFFWELIFPLEDWSCSEINCFGAANRKKKTLQGTSLISPPPIQTLAHTHTDIHTHTQLLKYKHFPFCVSNLFYPLKLPVCLEGIQSH